MEIQIIAAVTQTFPERVTNISELFQALSVGWDEGKKRKLIAGKWGGQFIRVFGERPHHYYNKSENDIPVDSGSYRMTGFIKFESKIFKGMFETYIDDQDVFCEATLTEKGFEFAKLNIVDFDYAHSSLSHVPFFNPSIKEIKQDLMLGKS